MSLIKLQGNASGTGAFTIAAPNGNTDRTLTLPDATGTVVTDTATQTLTNKTIQGGALTLGTAQNSTSGTNIDFTGIPSWAKRVTVMFSGVSFSGTDNLLVRIGSSGGIEDTGYSSGSVIATSASATAGSNSSVGFLVAMGGAAANSFTGTVRLELVGSNVWVASVVGNISAGSNGVSGGGSKTLSGTLDRVRLLAGGGNTFDAGTINIMWEG